MRPSRKQSNDSFEVEKKNAQIKHSKTISYNDKATPVTENLALGHEDDGLGDEVIEDQQIIDERQLDYEFRSPDRFLEAITVYVDIQQDLGLYQLHRSFSNVQMSVIGINLMNPDI